MLMFLSISEIFEGNQSADAGSIVRMSGDKLTLMKGMLDKGNTASREDSRIHRLDGGDLVFLIVFKHFWVSKLDIIAPDW